MGFYEPVFFLDIGSRGSRFSRLQHSCREKKRSSLRFAPTVTFKRAQHQDKTRETQTKLF